MLGVLKLLFQIWLGDKESKLHCASIPEKEQLTKGTQSLDDVFANFSII